MAGTRSKIHKSTLAECTLPLLAQTTPPFPSRLVTKGKKITTIKGGNKAKNVTTAFTANINHSTPASPPHTPIDHVNKTTMPSLISGIDNAMGFVTGEVSIAPGSVVKTMVPGIFNTSSSPSCSNIRNSISPGLELHTQGIQVDHDTQHVRKVSGVLNGHPGMACLETLEKLTFTLSSLKSVVEDQSSTINSMNTFFISKFEALIKSINLSVNEKNTEICRYQALDQKITNLSNKQAEIWNLLLQTHAQTMKLSVNLSNSPCLSNLKAVSCSENNGRAALTDSVDLSSSSGGTTFPLPLPLPSGNDVLGLVDFELHPASLSNGNDASELVEHESPLQDHEGENRVQEGTELFNKDALRLDFTPVFYIDDGYEKRSFNIKVFLKICRAHWKLRSIAKKDITRIQYFSNSQNTITSRFTFEDPDLTYFIWAHQDHFLKRGLEVGTVSLSPLIKTQSTADIPVVNSTMTLPLANLDLNPLNLSPPANTLLVCENMEAYTFSAKTDTSDWIKHAEIPVGKQTIVYPEVLIEPDPPAPHGTVGTADIG